MSAIKQALARLDQAVARLDKNVYGLEKQMAGQQRDMFGAPPNGANDDDLNGHTIDGAVIAKRLDQAIEKVEIILGQARGRAHG